MLLSIGVMEERNKGFFCFASFYDSMVDLMETDKDLALKYIKAVMEYGLYGEYDDSDNVVNALMNPVVIAIDNAGKRQEKNKIDGSKGGAKRKYNYEEVWRLADSGLKNTEIAELIGCNPRTVTRIKKERFSEENKNSWGEEEGDKTGQDRHNLNI